MKRPHQEALVVTSSMAVPTRSEVAHMVPATNLTKNELSEGTENGEQLMKSSTLGELRDIITGTRRGC
jgi:hypothetical protein